MTGMRSHVRRPVSLDGVLDRLELEAASRRDGLVSHAAMVEALSLEGLVEDQSASGADGYLDARGCAEEEFGSALLHRAVKRSDACGGRYPFDVAADTLEYRTASRDRVYLALLAMTLMRGSTAKWTEQGTKLFEHICASAAGRYLGNRRDEGGAYVFGTGAGSKPLGQRIIELADAMGEIGGPQPPALSARKKDAKLDVVAWRNFPDARPGKLTLFGQCATGSHWRDKRTEFLVDSWLALWVTDRPLVEPIRCFFVPRCVDDDEWRETCAEGGLVFDRARIAHFARPDGATATEVSKWTREAISRLARGGAS